MRLGCLCETIAGHSGEHPGYHFFQLYIAHTGTKALAQRELAVVVGRLPRRIRGQVRLPAGRFQLPRSRVLFSAVTAPQAL
jgi:hypothetical protein